MIKWKEIRKMSTFVLSRNYELILPESYVDVNNEEMEYVDGGWNFSITGINKI